jgi:hypothetical protein
MADHKDIKLLDHVAELAEVFVAKFGYQSTAIDTRIVFLTGDDNVPRLLLASRSDTPDVFDIAFSPIAAPAEVATVMTFLINEMPHLDVKVARDFYLCKDMQMKYGSEAMMAFIMDMVDVLDRHTEPSKKKDDTILDKAAINEYLKQGLFVIKQPLRTIYNKATEDKNGKGIKKGADSKKVR